MFDINQLSRSPLYSNVHAINFTVFIVIWCSNSMNFSLWCGAFKTRKSVTSSCQQRALWYQCLNLRVLTFCTFGLCVQQLPHRGLCVSALSGCVPCTLELPLLLQLVLSLPSCHTKKWVTSYQQSVESFGSSALHCKVCVPVVDNDLIDCLSYPFQSFKSVQRALKICY